MALSRITVSSLIGQTLVGARGEAAGKVVDVVVRLVDGALPKVTGVLVRHDGRDFFVTAEDVRNLSEFPLHLRSEHLDSRSFERRKGEVVLAGDVLGRDVIDVEDARLIEVEDVVLDVAEDGCHVAAVVPDAPSSGLAAMLSRAIGRKEAPAEAIPWASIEPLTDHVPTADHQIPIDRLAELHPAEIADIVESASHDQGQEILDAVHEDRELEADVFEELDEKHQVEFIEERSDAEAAAVLATMEPDAAVDLLMELDQDRRRPILDQLPGKERGKLLSLLGYHPETAGGMMSTELLALAPATTAAEAIAQVRELADGPPILTDVFVVEDGRLVGALTLLALLRADSRTTLAEVMEPEPVAVYPDADVPSVAVEMADYDLSALPVVDGDGRLVGVVTYDDLVKALIPGDWRRRGRAEHARLADPSSAL